MSFFKNLDCNPAGNRTYVARRHAFDPLYGLVGLSNAVVPKVGSTAPPGDDEAEMGSRGAIGDSVNNYIYVVLVTLSDQMS